MRPILIILFLFVVAGCSSIPTTQVDSRLNEWRNGSIDDLVKFWGLPTRQLKLGENHIAEWVNQLDKDSNVAVSVGGGSYGRRSSIGLGVNLFNLGGEQETCQRQVTYTAEGVILKIIWSGDSDYCYKLTPDRQKILQKLKAVKKQQSKTE